jgi:hypothetical protein
MFVPFAGNNRGHVMFVLLVTSTVVMLSLYFR